MTTDKTCSAGDQNGHEEFLASMRSKISKPAISNHLKILKEADLVSEKKYQQNRIYSLNKKQIKQIINYLDKIT